MGCGGRRERVTEEATASRLLKFRINSDRKAGHLGLDGEKKGREKCGRITSKEDWQK